MECREPGAIRDEELMAYLEGAQVRSAVVTHLARCSYCAQQLAHYQRLERKLTGKLYRWDCPPNQVLGEYHLRMLSAEQERQIRSHVQSCLLCAAELSTLTGFMAQGSEPIAAFTPNTQEWITPVLSNNHHKVAVEVHQAIEYLGGQADRVAEGVRRIVAHLLSSPQARYRNPSKQTALWPRSYMAEDVQISLQLEREDTRSQGTEYVQLLGLVTRDGVALKSLQGTHVHLLTEKEQPDTKIIQTQNIDELGNFVFNHLAPAIYTLELQFAHGTVAIEQLTLDLPI